MFRALCLLMLRQAIHASLLASLILIGLGGCFARKGKLTFKSNPAPYQRIASEIEYADVAAGKASQEWTAPPLALSLDREPVYWELPVEEAVRLALANSRVLRDLGGLLLRSPETTPTMYGPALTETDPRFGIEAALSEFDAIVALQALGGKNDRPLNNNGGPNSPESFLQDVTVVEGEIQKRAATGSLFALRHILDYDANNTPSNRFPTIWNTHVEGEFRQPLLQGAGVNYNRIAGLNGVPGQSNGVLVARVNTDISLADFEMGVRDLVSNVENAYWDLYFAYRDLDAKISARNSALESWRRVNALFIAGRLGAEREAEIREQYFRFEEEVQNALAGRLLEGTQTNNGSSGGSFRATGGVQVAERRLRLLLGLPINDGRLIRPADEPPLAKVIFDWDEVTSEALVRRAELRRQKWIIKRRELELAAARNYLLPQLDAVGLYRWRGMGDTLIAQSDAALDRFDEAYDNLLNGYYQEWQVGMEFSMPLGFRRGHSAVRNAQLQLARERSVLDEQEREVLLGLSNAIAEVERAWGVAQTNYNRRLAARSHLSAVEAAFESDKADLDMVLEAQRRTSEADTRFFATLAEYALAIKNVHFEKGSLLDHNEVYLAEGPWPGKAYDDAEKRDWRTRPIWPLNYIFKKGPVISAGPLPQQTVPLSPAQPEVIPLPVPDSPPVPEPLPPGETSASERAHNQSLAAEHPQPASVTVSDSQTDRSADGQRITPGTIRAAMQSAVWPQRWQ
jgi:outer membrane protein TolC